MNTAVRLTGYATVTVLLGAGAYLAGTVAGDPTAPAVSTVSTQPAAPADPMAGHEDGEMPR